MAILFSSCAHAWDYSTSPCIPSADLNPAENTAKLHSDMDRTNMAIADEIQKSVGADLSMPLSSYSAAAPSGSELYVGSAGVSDGQVSVNGVDLGTASTNATPSPCVIELKPAETK